MTAQLEVVWVARRMRPLCHILSGRTDMAAHLRFAKLILNKPQDFSSNALWTDKTRVEMFGYSAQQHGWRKPNRVNQHKHHIRTVG